MGRTAVTPTDRRKLRNGQRNSVREIRTPGITARPRFHPLITSQISRLRTAVSAVAGAWDKFWFAPADPTVLGLMRLLAGGMLLYTHLVWGIDLPAFIGSAGWNSPDVLAVVQDGRIVPSFWWYIPDAWMYPVHWLCVAVLTMFWVGFATRITSVLSLVIAISYSYRAHLSNFGLDQINAIICLYLCIGPSGAVLSVDRLLKVWSAKRKAMSAGWIPGADSSTSGAASFVSPPVLPASSANLAIRLTQLHFCVIYAYAGLSKLQGPAWWSGAATWMAFANLEYQSVDMTWLAWYPWICDLMTHTTIVWEVFFPVTVWVRPIRPVVLGMGFLMHLGIGALMGMWTFALIMVFGHVSFWPAGAVRRVVNWIPSAERVLNVPSPVLVRPSEYLREENGGELAISKALESGASRRRKSRRATASRPSLLCVDRGVRRRLHCLSYFLDRGFHFLATDDLEVASGVREASDPDAVLVLGEGLNDVELASFHKAHYEQVDPQPLFMVLSPGQSQRLNGGVQGERSRILKDGISLGLLRREIQATLAQSDERFDQDLPDPVSGWAESAPVRKPR